jgi:hypothetical protein
MNLCNRFAVNIILALFLGLSCALLLRWVFALHGITADDLAFWAARLLGGSILGFSILIWLGFCAAPIEFRRATAGAFLE